MSKFYQAHLSAQLKDPGAAAMLSIIPGLGHIYEGQKRKGILFLAVSAINVLLFLVIALNDQVIANMIQIGTANHIQPNEELIKVLKQVSFGSTVSIMFAGLFLSFLAYAVQDAYDQASFTKRRQIYPEHIWEMPEATSSSYIVHFALMASCFILAMFFLVPPKPKQQVTDIMFIENFVKQKQVKKITRIHSTNNAKESGKHDPQKEIATKSSPSAVQPKQERKIMPKAFPNLPATQRPMASHPSSQPSISKPTAPMPMPQAATNNATFTTPIPAQLPAIAPRIAGLPIPVPVPRSTSHLSATAPMPTARNGLHAGEFGSTPQARQVNLSPGSAGTSLPFAKSNTGNGNAFAPNSNMPIASTNFGSTQGNLPMPKSTTNFGQSNGSGTANPQPIRSTNNSGMNGNGFVPVAPSIPRPSPGSDAGVGREANSDANHSDGRPSPDISHDPNFGPYMDELQRRIKRVWIPPKDQETKRVVVNFKIHSDGSLSHLRIEKSSGSALADQAALKAVQDAQPFKQLPKYSPSDVDIQFTFDYNVFGGHRR